MLGYYRTPAYSVFSSKFYLCYLTCNDQPMSYLSLIVQVKTMMVVKIFLKRKLFVESA